MLTYHEAKNTPLIGGTRNFADIIPAYVQFPDYETARKHNSELARLDAYDESGAYCGISGHLDCHHSGIWRVYMTELAPIVLQVLTSHALPVPHDTISFKLIRRTDGLFLFYTHSQIIGGRCIARLDPATIPAAWTVFDPLR